MKNQQKIIFVTGKGGVGKSLTSAALAYKYSQMGQRVLLVELSFHSFFKQILPLKAKKKTNEWCWGENLSLVNWQGLDCLKEYILHYVKIESLADIFFENKILKSLIYAAPALNELSVLGKITSGVRNFGKPLLFDKIIVDAYSTGHFLALLKAPEGMQEAIRFGPMAEKCKEILRVLKDPNLVEYKIVSLAEEMSVVEASELYEQIKKEWGVTPSFICNRVVSQEVNRLLSEDNIPNSFKAEYQLKIKSQSVSQKKLKENVLDFQEIPYFYLNDSVEIIKKMSQYLGEVK